MNYNGTPASKYKLCLCFTKQSSDRASGMFVAYEPSRKHVTANRSCSIYRKSHYENTRYYIVNTCTYQYHMAI